MRNLLAKTCLLAAAVSLLPHCAFSQGFSGTLGMGAAKTVGIKQLLPATVNLNQKHIKIAATSAIKTNGELVPILETKLKTMIQKDPRFIIDERNPQTTLTFSVTNSYIEEKHYTVGTGNGTQACTAFTGKLEVSYQAIDDSNNVPLDSENLVAAISDGEHDSGGGTLGGFKDILRVPKHGACGTEAKSTMHEAQDALVDGIVHAMGQRAAPTDTIIEVKLPGKKLEPLGRLALAQRWATLEEEAQKTEALPKPEDDAYRLYLIALAKEAQAYDLAREAAKRENGSRSDITEAQAEADFQRAMRLIDQARKLYKDAIQAKPNEKEFLEPDTRMEKAVSVYAVIQRHKDEYQKALLAKQSAPPSKSVTAQQQGGGARQPVPDAMQASTPLEQVVKFCQAGMGMDTITDYIKDPSFLADAKTSGYKFDFKTDPFTLNASCKQNASVIQKLMRDRLATRTGTAKK